MVMRMFIAVLRLNSARFAMSSSLTWGLYWLSEFRIGAVAPDVGGGNIASDICRNAVVCCCVVAVVVFMGLAGTEDFGSIVSESNRCVDVVGVIIIKVVTGTKARSVAGTLGIGMLTR